jgi:hypothetical protein
LGEAHQTVAGNVFYNGKKFMKHAGEEVSNAIDAYIWGENSKGRGHSSKNMPLKRW